MLVYGDAVRRESVGEKIGRIRSHLAESGAAAPWIVAHGLLVAALVEAGELAQGIADRAFEAAGKRDGRSEDAEAAMALTVALAEAVGRSWTDGVIVAEGAVAAIARVERAAAGGELTIKLPEGFAHYALYPETYREAARPLAGRELRVVGIRSIGTTLAAMVAAGSGAPCPVTVRPVGHPFGRTLALLEPLAIPPGAEVAIADEGPGLSGSSIAAVAAALQASGVGPERMHLFPSHANGPGPQAAEPVRRFWQTARIRVRSFDEVLLAGEGRRSLTAWVQDLTGEPVGNLREITGGAWREERDWPGDLPPVHPWQEKRKFLLESRSGTWLLKFAGLGRIGLAKHAHALALAEAGFAPRPLGFRHGFLVERWHGEATTLDPLGPERPHLLALLARYLGFRARRFPSGPASGASCEQLLAMLRFNAEEEFGEDLARAAERWCPRLPALASEQRFVATDNRLHAWEWLRLPDGRLLKTDALDHHAGHDLVGCQDVAWDIAGATVEFTLSPGEQADLIERIEQVSSLAVDRTQVRFAMLCYPAFQLGYYREAAASAPDSSEAARLGDAARRYSSVLRAFLASGAEPAAPAAG